MKPARTSLKIILSFFFLGIAGYAHSQILAENGGDISYSEMDSFVKKEMDSLGIPGISLAIFRDGKIIYHRAVGYANKEAGQKVDENSLFEAASMSKPVFSYLAMKMVESGKLDLDRPLYQYLPYPDIAYDDRYKAITARMVLMHSSGLPNWRWDRGDSAIRAKVAPHRLYIKFTPGTKHDYSGEGFVYLSMVVAHLNNGNLKNLDSVFQKEVAAPLGMEHSYFVWDPYIPKHKVMGYIDGKNQGNSWPTPLLFLDSTKFIAAGGLHTEATDYAKFLIGFMEYKDLKKKYVDEMLTRQIEVPKDDVDYIYLNDTAWGLGIAIKSTKYGPCYEHDGDNGDFKGGFMFSMRQKTGYVVFANSDRGDTFNTDLQAFLLEGKK